MYYTVYTAYYNKSNKKDFQSDSQLAWTTEYKLYYTHVHVQLVHS